MVTLFPTEGYCPYFLEFFHLLVQKLMVHKFCFWEDAWWHNQPLYIPYPNTVSEYKSPLHLILFQFLPFPLHLGISIFIATFLIWNWGAHSSLSSYIHVWLLTMFIWGFGPWPPQDCLWLVVSFRTSFDSTNLTPFYSNKFHLEISNIT